MTQVLTPRTVAVGPAGDLSVRLADVVAIPPSEIGCDEVTPGPICFVTTDGEPVGGESRVAASTVLDDVHLASTGFDAPRFLTDEELGQVASESARRRYGAAAGTTR